MRRDPKSYLWDARQAIAAIAEFILAADEVAYRNSALLRSAVERQLEILGEALGQLEKQTPDLASRITDLRSAVDLRNILIHGYATIDDRIVWHTVHYDLPKMARELDALLPTYEP